MTGEISIWRWAVEDDLEARFARLVAATDDEFATLAGEMMQEGAEELPDVDEMYRQTEEKMRAMNLPPEQLATMLAGLKAMREEAQEEWEAEDDDLDDEGFDAVDPSGRIGVALASSHMFYDDPYASLEYEEIEAQVAAAMAGYRAAISKAVGDEGQSLAAFLGLAAERLYEDDAFDVLMEAGLAEVEWLWVKSDQVMFLSQWHEDKELPIDLEFSRAPLAVFEAVKAQMAGSHEM